jgi:hypothetical protein
VTQQTNRSNAASAATSVPARTAAPFHTASATASRSTASSLDDDFDSLLADMDSAIAKPAPKPTKITVRDAPTVRESSTAASKTSTFGAGATSKCYPTIITNGGPVAKSCPALLCVMCDQRVLCIRAARWKNAPSSTKGSSASSMWKDDSPSAASASPNSGGAGVTIEYMFFRNHYPDLKKLQTGVERDPTSAAYACACSWQSVGVDTSGGETLNLASLHRDSSPRDGCSDWTKLKWVCMGH